jgi:hypothetical protein
MTPEHLGSDFDDFLGEEGLLEEAATVAAKRVIAFQIGRVITERDLSKRAMAPLVRMSRSEADA